MLYYKDTDYKGVYRELEVPEKIFCLDDRFPKYESCILTLELVLMDWDLKSELIFKIVNIEPYNFGAIYDYFWIEEMLILKYIDYERAKNIKAFL